MGTGADGTLFGFPRPLPPWNGNGMDAGAVGSFLGMDTGAVAALPGMDAGAVPTCQSWDRRGRAFIFYIYKLPIDRQRGC